MNNRTKKMLAQAYEAGQASKPEPNKVYERGNARAHLEARRKKRATPGQSKYHYIKINGVRYARELVEAAREAVEGVGDGRISQADAEMLLEQVKDDGTYTDVEKNTVKYIRENFTWTDAADDWFRTEIRRWAAERGRKKKEQITIDNVETRAY